MNAPGRPPRPSTTRNGQYTVRLSREASGWAQHFALDAGVTPEEVIARLVEERLFIFRMPMDQVLALAGCPRPTAKVEADISSLQTIAPEPASRRKTIGAGGPRRRDGDEVKDRF